MCHCHVRALQYILCTQQHSPESEVLIAGQKAAINQSIAKYTATRPGDVVSQYTAWGEVQNVYGTDKGSFNNTMYHCTTQTRHV